jgi:hypothetical protein
VAPTEQTERPPRMERPFFFSPCWIWLVLR